MNKKLKAKWIKALLSGEYVQGKEYLRRRAGGSTPTKYCCLGVLCEISGAKWERKANVWGFTLPSGTFVANDETEIIGNEYGLTYSASDYAELNDDGDTFKDIAKIIRQGE